MKQILLMITVVALVGCAEKANIDYGSNSPEAKAAIEAAIRKELKEPDDDLTKEDLGKVKSLSLSYDKLTDASPLAEFTQLDSLDLSNNQLTDVSALSGLTKLDWLSLSNNQLTDVNALGGLTNLTTLDLRDNQLTNVKGLEGLKQLRVLDLRHAAFRLQPVRPASGPLADVSALSGLTQLTTLKLDNNRITDDQLKHLVGLKWLKRLDLYGNNIMHVTALLEFKQLEILNLRNNPNLTPAEIEKLRKALPQCVIYSNAALPAKPPTSVDEIRRLVLGKTKTEVKALFERPPDRTQAQFWIYNLRVYDYDAERFSHLIWLSFSGPGGRCSFVEFDLVN